MTVGEMPGVTPEEAILYTGEDRQEVNMVFQFEHMDVDSGPGGKWDVIPFDLIKLKEILNKWQVELHDKGWNSLYWNNHDQPRIVSRFGNDGENRVKSAKMLGTLLHMMQGTPYIYQGEELGMTNVQFNSIQEYRDIETLNMYNEKIAEGKNPDEIMKSIYIKGRDNARTPMQWDSQTHGGFTTGEPWLALNPNYKEINAEEAVNDPHSVFHYYKKLIKLRKENPIIVYGTYKLILEEDKQVYAYTRTLDNQTLLVITNFYPEEVEFNLPETITFQEKELWISNYDVNEKEDIKQD